MATKAPVLVNNIATLNTAQKLTAMRGATGGVGIKALPGNSGTVWIGGSDVDTTHGWPLAAGESIVVGVAMSDIFYVYGAANDKVAVMSVGN